MDPAITSPPIIDIPDITSYVNDNAGILDANAEASLTEKLKTFSESGKGELAILTVKNLNGLSIDEFAIHVTEKWEKENNGILLTISTDERKVRIQAGGETTITDSQAGQILDDVMVPKLKRADFAGAINDGVDAIIKLINTQ